MLKRMAILFPALAGVLPGQEWRATMEASIAKQRAAIEVQRAAIRKQTSTPGQGQDFFTAPWVTVQPLAQPSACVPASTDEIRPIVAEVSKREGIGEELLRAVIDQESRWASCAVSAKGAQGLMQLMPDTAASLGISDSFDARQNVEGGARFLKQLLDRYHGDVPLALAAYNAGPRVVDAAGGLPAIPETLDYVRRSCPR